MNITDNILITSVILFISAVIYAFYTASINRKQVAVNTKVDDRMDNNQKLRDLEGMVRVLQRDHVLDQEKIASLDVELQAAKVRIKELEIIVDNYRKTDQQQQLTRQRSLLIGTGTDNNLQIDLISLRKVKAETGLNFSRLMPISFINLRDTLVRARKADRPIKYLHLAVHSCANGVQFNDGAFTGQQLSEILQDVEVMVINGCESAAIGDLIGVVPVIITMREKVAHKDAADFAEIFWLKIGSGVNPEEAFYVALDRVPAVAEFAEIHL